MKRTLWWRFIGIAVLTLLLLANIVPWSEMGDGFQAQDLTETLRLGIDLAGGTRLVYEVDVENWKGGAGKPNETMIAALKKRVDPMGRKNLIWQPVGENRIEITMPRATRGGVQQRQQFEQARNQLLATNISPSDIARARNQATEAQRKQALLDLVRGVPARQSLLLDLNKANEDLLAAHKAATATSPEALDAEIAYEKALDKVMATNLRWLDVFRVMRMEPKQRTAPQIRRGQRGEEIASPSPLENLKARYPARYAEIEKVFAAYDKMAEAKAAQDDPDDLKRLLQGTGNLEFFIAVYKDELSDSAAYVRRLEQDLSVEGPYRWYKAADADMVSRSGLVAGYHNNEPYILVHTAEDKKMVHPGPPAPGQKAEPDWRFERAFPTRDNWQAPAVGFQFDQIGGDKFRRLTSANLQKPLAAVLDGTVLSAPTIQARIGSNGIITGSFSVEEVQDLADKLQAGALPGTLRGPISENRVGPQLAAQAATAGFSAAVWAVIGVAVFMLVYYLVPLGAVAIIAIICNLIYILGIMASGQVIPGGGFDFTLPGIAALALTIGMAVDANVLIDERIREEQNNGATLRTAVKNGYGKALSTIMDANITTLITTLILYFVGTSEIKGFAIVLMIGVVASVFTAVIVTRVLLQLGIEYGWLKRNFRMLRLISVPKIRWMDKRYGFWTASAILLIAGLWAFFRADPQQLYDVQFIGGTKAQVTLAPGVQANEVSLEELLHTNDLLKGASVRRVLQQGEAGSRQSFEISVPYRARTEGLTGTALEAARQEAENQVRQAISSTLIEPAGRAGFNSSLLPRMAELDFANETAMAKLVAQNQLDQLPDYVSPITDETIARYPQINADVLRGYIGGVAIELTGLEPALTLDEMRARIRGELSKERFQGLPSGDWAVFGTKQAGASDGEPAFSQIVFVAQSNEYIYDSSPLANNGAWRNDFVHDEVQMLYAAASRSDVIDSIQTFDPSMASDVKTSALLAIGLSLAAVVIYVAIRFGSVLFGIGAILPLFHDVAVVIGLIAISKWLAGTAIGHALLITDFRFDVTVVAAVLTVIGYSLNDTIVVFDRIRENRGRLQFVSGRIIDDSINQTMSRTLLTGLTTFLAIFVMYVFGGPGIHAFCFAMMVGLIVGTYSSIAVASPVLMGARLFRRSASSDMPA